jgi:hypothetical protein
MRLPERRDESGAIAVVVALCMVVLLIVGGMVVDLGRARSAQLESQNSADASALAAANALYPATTCANGADGGPPCLRSAVAAAKTYAAQNFSVSASAWTQSCSFGAGFTSVPGETSCVQFDSLSAPSKIWVQIPTLDVEMTLGKLVGLENVPISMRAQAALSQGSSGACGLCVLNASAMSGNSKLTVNNAGVGMNGKPSFSGNTTLKVNNGIFTTEKSPSTSGNTNFDPGPVVGPTVDDPYQNVPLPPSLSGLPVVGNKSLSGNGACSLTPGIYGNISVSGNHVCYFSAGLYVVTGTISLSGNTTIDATTGVTFYFTCGSPSSVHECGTTYPYVETGGALSYSGNQVLKIISPTSGPTQGFAILYDRNNNAGLSYSGNQNNILYGSVYAASSTMNMSGNSGTTGIDTSIVVKGLNLSGNSEFTLNYTEARNPSMSKPSIALSR